MAFQATSKYFMLLVVCLCSPHIAPYCSLNHVVKNGGTVNKTRGTVGSVVRYYCKPGYRMIGHINATCRHYPNGMYRWDFPAPLCQGKRRFKHFVCFKNGHYGTVVF